jgi:uncharacterized repeat protein (TIGR03843 family)
MPVLRPAAQSGGPHLSADERLPELTGSSWSGDLQLSTDEALRALRDGDLEIEGRLSEASNLTLYCGLAGIDAPDGALHAVYKPIRGERPLDDFPHRTLGLREVAAWHVSEASGLGVVPPTVLRDGPYGKGMAQLWIDVDDEADILEMILTRDPRLRSVALLDAILNNADRKGGHLLPTRNGSIHGCDHGVTFAVEPKLRTVLWGWRGEPLEPEEVATLERVRTALEGTLGMKLGELLAPAEVDATCRRIDQLLRDGTMPVPDPYRHVIPWPPF